MNKTKIGIVGCGAIGEGVARFIERELSKKAILWGIADKDTEKAENLLDKLSSTPRILDTESLIKNVNLVIETASVEAARYVLKKAVEFRKNAIILSVGALIENRAILKTAQERNIEIHIPSGAICGVDGVGALSLGGIKKITLTTSKPPRGLAGAQYLIEKRINLTNLKKEKIIFKGSVSEAIRYFPQNINVAATLFLAATLKKGSHFNEKNIEVCIKADPNVKANVHRITIEAEETTIEIVIKNVPSETNPKTSALAILSTQHLLNKIFSSFKVGS
jgi:aspartate dehydrogenase